MKDFIAVVRFFFFLNKYWRVLFTSHVIGNPGNKIQFLKYKFSLSYRFVGYCYLLIHSSLLIFHNFYFIEVKHTRIHCIERLWWTQTTDDVFIVSCIFLFNQRKIWLKIFNQADNLCYFFFILKASWISHLPIEYGLC